MFFFKFSHSKNQECSLVSSEGAAREVAAKEVAVKEVAAKERQKGGQGWSKDHSSRSAMRKNRSDVD